MVFSVQSRQLGKFRSRDKNKQKNALKLFYDARWVISSFFSSIFIRICGDVRGLWGVMQLWMGWFVSVLVGLGFNKLLLGPQSGESAVDIFLGLEGMPLSDGSTRVRQHVRPVLRWRGCGFASDEDLPDGIILADLVVVKDGHRHDDFLGSGEMKIIIDSG